MTLQSSYRYELIKLADKLNSDYYPLTELLCRNALVQANWLCEEGKVAEMTACMALCNELNDMVSQHLLISKTALSILSEGGESKYIRGEELRVSQGRIKNTLAAIEEEATSKKMVKWREMHDTLCMKLKVLQNLLIELFKIENTSLLPILDNKMRVN